MCLKATGSDKKLTKGSVYGKKLTNNAYFIRHPYNIERSSIPDLEKALNSNLSLNTNL